MLTRTMSRERGPSADYLGLLDHADILELDTHEYDLEKLTPRLKQALAVAAEAHAGQRRKLADKPFLAHPFETMLMVGELYGIDPTTAAPHSREEDLLVAALLHDTVEDSDGRVTQELIAQEFGGHAAEMVDVATKDKSEDIARYYDKLRATTNCDALRLVATDKTHALTCRIAELHKHQASDKAHSVELFNVTLEDKMTYYRTILEIARDRLPPEDPAIAEFALLMEMYNQQIEHYQSENNKTTD